MGSIVKKIKKKVKKVIKKNPVTRIVKKATKNIRKLGSKLWTKVKKFGKSAFRKFAKFSDKIGPIGMIALSFAMPYLMAGMGQAWAGLGNWLGAAAKVAPNAGMTFGNTLAQLGHSAWSGISRAGHFIKGTYQGITQTLSKTFEGFAGVKNAAGVRTGGSVSEGFSNLWKGTGDVLSGRAGMGTEKLITTAVETGANWSPTIARTTPMQVGTGQFTRSTGVWGTSSGVVQTGGVQAFNANQMNMASQQIINQAMSGTTSMYTPDVQTYANTLSKEHGLNSYDAHKHMMENGVSVGDANKYTLDFSQSKDFGMTQFREGASGVNYHWTGDTANVQFKDYGMDYVGIKDSKLRYQGPDNFTYGSQDKTPSLLQRGGSAAMSYLTSLGQDPGENPYVPMGGSAGLDPFGTRYAGSDVYAATSGQFLNRAQSDWFMGAKERMDYRGN